MVHRRWKETVTAPGTISPFPAMEKVFEFLVFWPYALGDTFLREMNNLDFFLSLLSDPPFGSRIDSHQRARSDLWKVCAEKVYLQWDMRFRCLDWILEELPEGFYVHRSLTFWLPFLALLSKSENLWCASSQIIW